MSVFLDVRRDEIGVIPCPEARYNRSPIVLVENKLGVESWCVKFLLPCVHNQLLQYRQRRHWLDRDGRSAAPGRLGSLHPDQPSAGACTPQPWWTSPPPCCCSTPTSPPPGTSGRATAARPGPVAALLTLAVVAGRSCCSAASSHQRRSFIWENWPSPSSPRARRRGSTGKPRPVWSSGQGCASSHSGAAGCVWAGAGCCSSSCRGSRPWGRARRWTSSWPGRSARR